MAEADIERIWNSTLKPLIVCGFADAERAFLMDTSAVPREAGVYALYATRPASSAMSYLQVAAADGKPVYIGKADGQRQPLPVRAAQHAASIRAAETLDIAWFAFAFVALPSELCAAAEAAIVSAVGPPPWQGSGFGNKTPGVERATQKVSEWDAVHTGRGRGELTLPAVKQRNTAAVLEKWAERLAAMNMPAVATRAY